MPDETAGNFEGTPAGDSGSAPVGTPEQSAPASFDWQGFRGTLGDMGKEKSLDPIFAAKDPGHALTKSYIEAQKMIGNSIRLPGKDAKPEDRQTAQKEIIAKLRQAGVMESPPETPDGYDIKFPQIDGFKPNEPLMNGFKQTAHNMGIPPSQVQGLFDWYLNFQEESDRAEKVEFEGMKQGLKRELGGLYPRKMEAARRAVARFIGEDGDNIISQLPPAIGKKLVMAFAEIGDPLLEDDLATGGIPGVITKEHVKAQIDTMFNDPKHPLNDLSHRQHQEAVNEYTKLQQQYIRLGGK